MKVKRTSWKKVISLSLVLSVLLTSQGKWQTPQSLEAKESEVTRDEIENQEESQGVIAEKTESATIYDLGNGTKRAEIYAGDVRYKEKNGEIVDYDTSLIENQETVSEQGNDVDNYAYKTKQSEKVSYFPEKVNEKTPIMTEYDEYLIKITPAEKVKKTSVNREMVEDLYKNKEKKITSVDYESKTEDTNYRYESTNDGVKETIILEGPTKNNQFDFSITLKNCGFVTQEDLKKDSIDKLPKKLETSAGEDLYLYDIQEKKLVGAMPAAFMLDGEGNYNEDCSYQVKQEKKSKKSYEYTLTLTVSKEYLEDEKRVYPISIDPSFVWNGDSLSGFTSAYVCSTAPAKTYNDSGTNILCVGGRDSSKDICRAYMNFKGISTILEGYYVDSATLDLNLCQANVGMKMYVRQVDSSWSASTITYNRQPKRKELELAEFTTTNGSGKVSIPLYPETIDDCVREGTKVYGFEITDSIDDSNLKSSKTAWIYNGSSVNGTKVPKLTVVYEDKSKLTDMPHVSYQVCGNAKGAWSTTAQDGEIAGATTKTNSARAFKLTLDANGYSVGNVKCRAYYEGATKGWTSWIGSGEDVGDETKACKIKAIQMKAYNDEEGTIESTRYNIYYRVYVPGRGWLGWAKNGGDSGDYTSSGCISAMQAILVPKVVYGISYTMPNGETKTEEDILESTFHLVTGEGKRVYACGINFLDSEMRKKHWMNVHVTQENGSASVGISGTSADISMFGQSVTNKVVGYSFSFYDKTMRSRYDIEHMASVSTAKEEEKWVLNRRYSGSKQSGEALETMSVRIVPKDYREGQKACYSDEFLVTEDGYSFVNSGGDFNYQKGYVIPLEKYVALYGEVGGKYWYDYQVGKGGWGGSCFGMSLSSLFYKTKQWDISQVSGSIDKDAESVFGLCTQRGKKDKKMRDVIEYMQITQQTHDVGTVYKETEDNFSQIISYLQKYPQSPYLMLIHYSYKNENGDTVIVGHAVVPLGISQDESGKYKIALYDVNCPGGIQYATISADQTTFTYGPFTTAALIDANEMYALNKSLYDVIWNNSLTGIANSYKLAEMKNTNSIIVLDNTNVCITNAEGDDIGEGGKVKMSSSIDNPEVVTYTVPEGEYQISVTNPQKSTRVAVLNYDVSMKYDMETNGKIVVKFNKDKTINSTVEFTENKSENVIITTYDRHRNTNVKSYCGKKIVAYGKDKNSEIRKLK
nr:DNRLRE domain-containing protein [Eubacterium sp.]